MATYTATTGTCGRLADAAELIGGCAPGVEWGRTHEWTELADGFEPEWVGWMLEHFGAEMSNPLKTAFVRAAAREPLYAAALWHDGEGLTVAQYALLAEAASGYYTSFGEHVRDRQPGWRRHV